MKIMGRTINSATFALDETKIDIIKVEYTGMYNRPSTPDS